MNSRQRINSLFTNSPAGAGFWTGCPLDETVALYLQKTGLPDVESFYSYLNDDCRWIAADGAWRHPGEPIFDTLNGQARTSMSQPGCFADCKSLNEIDAHSWPDPSDFDFASTIEKIRSFKDKAVFTGMWSCFFHIVADYFGMENYFIKMYTDPKIVEAVTERVLEFDLEVNRQFFEKLGDDADFFFFGNDLGTQQSLLLSQDCFRKFVLPGIKRLVAQAKQYNKKVFVHSCGAISELIPMLIDAGIDGLHPLQAKAKGMDAQSLASKFGDKLVFMGGVDTQELLVHASPQEIKTEVRRLKEILGPRYIVSPSHEAILPNVPIENVIAMAQAAHE